MATGAFRLAPARNEKALPWSRNELVFSLTNAAVAARCLHVVAELGVADHIGDHPVPTKDLAQLCAVDLDGLDRVLRLLAAHGVFSCVSGGYQHSPASQLLRSDHPMSMRAFPQMMGLPVVLKSFDELAHSVRTGHPSIELSDPGGLWSYLKPVPRGTSGLRPGHDREGGGGHRGRPCRPGLLSMRSNRRRRRWSRPPAARRP